MVVFTATDQTVSPKPNKGETQPQQAQPCTAGATGPPQAYTGD